MFDVTDMNRIAPRESILNVTASEWISLAFGEEAAVQAMQLPADVRRSLFGVVMRWGPAGVESVAFLDALHTHLNTRIFADEGEWVASKIAVALIELAWTKTAKGFMFSEHMPLPAHLGTIIQASCVGLLSNKWEVTEGASIMLWMLNGQYVFPATKTAGEGALALPANEILALVGLPMLEGSFAGVVHA